MYKPVANTTTLFLPKVTKRMVTEQKQAYGAMAKKPLLWSTQC